jgi:hypothetical protein
MPGVSPASRALVGALFVACSVYDVPPRVDDTPGGGGDGGGSGGVTSTTAGKSAGGGNAPTSGGTAPASGGVSGSTVTPTSGTGGDTMPSGGGEGGVLGSGGDPTVNGGEGGAPPVVVDNCPNDPAKTEPGTCGCGFPDVATATLASCKTLISKLLHRYDFEGTGTTVTDRVGTAHGTVMGGATLSKVSGRGVVVLGGGTTGSYVDLPNGLVSVLTDATFEAWITWGGGNNFQRVFDFGDTDYSPPEDNPRYGKTYIFLSPKISSGGVTFGYSLMSSSQELLVTGTSAMPQALSQVVAIADATADTLTLYMDGVLIGRQAWTGALSSINDVNVWLGRSQYNGDPELTATYHDFRVYGAALSAQEVATAFKGGTDPAFLAK